jgi:hypothetical protein
MRIFSLSIEHFVHLISFSWSGCLVCSFRFGFDLAAHQFQFGSKPDHRIQDHRIQLAYILIIFGLFRSGCISD